MTTLGTLRSAIATDIGHAERILFDRRTADGEWSEDTDPVLCDLVDNLCDTLRSAREALEAQPPPADAGLLASANRELMGRLEEAEQELLCIRGWVEDDWALNCTERPAARAVVAMYAKLNGDARRAERGLSEAREELGREQQVVAEVVAESCAFEERAEKAERLGAEHFEALVKALARADTAERERDEARAEVARLQGRVKVLESFAEDRCHDADPDGRWCHCCPDPDGCPVAEDRAAHLDGEKEPTP